MPSSRVLEIQLSQLWHDHRSAQGRFVGMAALFPAVLGAAFTATITIPEDSRSALQVVAAFAPLLAFLWWGGLLAYQATGSTKRYRILVHLESRLLRASPEHMVYPVNAMMVNDAVGYDSVVRKRSTTLSVLTLIFVPVAAYAGLLTFAIALALSRSVAPHVSAITASLVTILSVMVFGSIIARIRFYLSEDFASAVRSATEA